MSDFAALEPLPGGWSGRTFLARAGEQGTVVRIFPPDQPPHAPEVQAAVLGLVADLLPVPRVLEVRRAQPADDQPGLLVTELLPGERGDLVLPRLEEAGLRHVGAQVGRLAATLGGIPTLRPGLFDDADLTIVPFALAEDLPAWIADHHEAFATWSVEERGGLERVAQRAQGLLDGVRRSCLVHSDLNPKNLLIDPDSWEVTGLVDWEFAHSGHPATDLGNVLRLEREPAYVDAVLAAYRELRGGDRAALLDLARAADLWALVDFAARAGENPVADRGRDLLRAIARSADLHAEV